MIQVNVQEAKTRFSELLGRIERGEDVTIARAGKPVARLVPIESPTRRELGFVAGGALPETFYEPLNEAELRQWDGT